jgi:phage terminase small subunit
MTRGISLKHEQFIEEYRLDRNGTRAYSKVYGVTAAAAAPSASKLLKKPKIAQELARLNAEGAKKAGIDPDRLLLEAWHIVTADPRELVEHVVGACRHCFGEGHKFQRTVAEYNADFERHTTLKGGAADAFDTKGGIGYDPRKKPNEACPECFGAGAGRTIVKDTRRLSPQALALYGGIRQTKDGVSVVTHSKLDALEKLFRNTGLYAEDNKQKRTPLGEALREFVHKMHGSGAGKAPVVPNIRRIK